MRLRREILDRKICRGRCTCGHCQIGSNQQHQRSSGNLYLITSDCFAEARKQPGTQTPEHIKVHFNSKTPGVQIHMRSKLVLVAVAQNNLEVISYKAKSCGNLILNAGNKLGSHKQKKRRAYEHHKHKRRHNSVESPAQKSNDVDRSKASKLVNQKSCDEIARERKEYVDANEAAWKRVLKKVIYKDQNKSCYTYKRKPFNSHFDKSLA